MWATDEPSPIGGALGAGIAAFLLAGSALGAQATRPTEADIELARQQHRMPSEGELASVPVTGAPRIENLPQPVTRMPIDPLAQDGFGTQTCANRVCGLPRQFVKATGDVTLEYAIQYLNRSSPSSALPRQSIPLVHRLASKVSDPLTTGVRDAWSRTFVRPSVDTVVDGKLTIEVWLLRNLGVVH